MSAKFEQLLEVKFVTDHDCGNYAIGEVDFGIKPYQLDQYLQSYGIKGRNDLLVTLGYLTHMVCETSIRIESKRPETQGYQAGSP